MTIYRAGVRCNLVVQYSNLYLRLVYRKAVPCTNNSHIEEFYSHNRSEIDFTRQLSGAPKSVHVFVLSMYGDIATVLANIYHERP